MQARHKHQGVTLVEAAVVLAIVAIVAGSAVPGFQAFIERQRLEAAADQLGTDLRFARAEAIARNAGLRVSVQTAPSGTCYVIHSGAPGECRCEATGPAHCQGDARELKTTHLPQREGITLHANTSSMLFDPLHGTCTPTGTLRVVAASGRAIHQVVNVMGRVRACSPQGPGTAVTGYRAC
jgi:type IV fimbrial biogenesis protein FimT